MCEINFHLRMNVRLCVFNLFHIDNQRRDKTSLVMKGEGSFDILVEAIFIVFVVFINPHDSCSALSFHVSFQVEEQSMPAYSS